MRVAVTGHRPEDLGSEETVRNSLRQALVESGAQTVIIGMAAGVDLWAGDEARKLGLALWCAKPWATHSARQAYRDLYQSLIEYADEIVSVTKYDSYPGPWVYQVRNRWMVDNADAVVAYWNGKKSGGTYNCVTYAQEIGREVINAYN